MAPMTSATSHAPERGEVLFSARLTPHRSLPENGFFWVMVFVGSVCFTVGLVFFMMGLWPVLGFMGLDVAAIYLALKFSYRSGRAHEDVEVSRRHLLVRKVNPRGQAREHWFNPFGTFLKVDRHPEFGVMGLAVTHREEAVPVGGFLDPDSKATFADAFALALSKAKR